MTTAPPDDASERRVVLLHGIRDNGIWQALVAQTVGEPGRVKVVPIGYGYLPVWGLLVPGLSRWAAVKTVERRLLGAINDQPDKNKRVSVIAHSFGTYAVTKVIEKNSNIEIDDLVLCGAIVPRQYDWGRIRRQIKGKIINDYGTQDQWPTVAGALTWSYGSTGTYGSGDPTTVTDRAHNIGHSEFLTEKFARAFWRSFFVDSELVAAPEAALPPPRWFRFVEWPWRYLLAALQISVVLLLLTSWPMLQQQIGSAGEWVRGAVTGVIDKVFPKRDRSDFFGEIIVTIWGATVIIMTDFFQSSSFDLKDYALSEMPPPGDILTGNTTALIALGADFTYPYALLALWRPDSDENKHCSAYALVNIPAVAMQRSPDALDGEYYDLLDAEQNVVARIGVRDSDETFVFGAPGQHGDIKWPAGALLSEVLPAADVVERQNGCSEPVKLDLSGLPSFPSSFQIN